MRPRTSKGITDLLLSEADGETFDADVPFRLLDGYDRLLERLAANSPAASVRLNVIVQSVRWSAGNVVIETTGGERFAARQVVITLPIGVLRASPGERGGVWFDPPLPMAMRDAIDHLRMGPVVKILLRFHRPFWSEGPWRDLGFLHAPGAAVPTWWTALPVRVPILTGWAGGPAGAALSHLPSADVIDAALDGLAPLLGVSPSTLRDGLADARVADWQADPFARGAYAFAAVGGAQAAQTLSEPIESKLFLAGEATHPGYSGTVNAAIASGRRAATQILGRVTGA